MPELLEKDALKNAILNMGAMLNMGAILNF
jgi:hypothetical protein